MKCYVTKAIDVITSDDVGVFIVSETDVKARYLLNEFCEENACFLPESVKIYKVSDNGDVVESIKRDDRVLELIQ